LIADGLILPGGKWVVKQNDPAFTL